ncbi:MAG: PhnD/SsuA/transferrin family substrate-binding protein [Deltaproteobacteria bacterium]|nr:PhnD/SsuA/transferrin family substrate-binding protein [Deltaproteobacteria bacterium]
MRSLPIQAVLVLAMLWGPPAARAESPAEPPVRIGYAQSIFKGRNQTDTIAAMKFWAKTIANDRGVPIDSRMAIFDTPEDAVAAVREKRIDGVTLSLNEFAAFPPGLLGAPFVRDEANGVTHVVYVLVAATNGPVRQVRDLRGARIVVHDGEYAGVGLAWLEAQLAVAGLGRLRDEAARMDLNEKPSGTVLPVFFGKADACLVRRSAFDTAVELNPQVGARLAIVAVSEPIIPSLLSFRVGVAEGPRDRLFREVLRIHETKTGQQVMTMFKCDRMAAVTSEEVDRSVRLLNDWQRVAAGGGPQ